MSGEGGSTTDASEGGDLPDVLTVRLRAQEEELRRLSAKLDEQLQYRTRLNRDLIAQRKQLAAANDQIAQLRSSVSFRLGSLMVGAARSPRQILAIPAELFKLFRELLPRISGRLARRWRGHDDALDLGPEFADIDLPLAGDA